MMKLPAISHPIVTKFRDYLRGFVARTAKVAGWPDAQAVAVALKADEIATAQIIAGVPPHDAMAFAIATADQIVTLDTFERLLADYDDDVDAAFAAISRFKNRTLTQSQNATKFTTLSKIEFENARQEGLSPAAALVCAHRTSEAFDGFKKLYGLKAAA